MVAGSGYSCYSDYISIWMIPKHCFSCFSILSSKDSLYDTFSHALTRNNCKSPPLDSADCGVLAMLMNALDSSIVNVALPSIQHDLHFSQANLTWVVDAYLIAFGSFLLLAGRLGDLLGRKEGVLKRVALFTASSFVCSLAVNQAMLIAARFFQGMGGAISTSVIVAIIVTEFSGANERAKAMSAYMFVAVGGGSIGLLVGRHLDPGRELALIFVINVPIGIVTFILVRS